jgi:CRISPR/Cas system-associated protein Cas10 (large subunit of type III CRISPR-Cas system)
MKGIQNKRNYISEYTYPVNVIRKNKFLKFFFSCPAYVHVPPHFRHHVRNHLDRKMTGRWISKRGPIAWPPRSADLTPLDYVKNNLYQFKINDLQHLKTLCGYGNIRYASSNVERGRISAGYLSCHQGSPH